MNVTVDEAIERVERLYATVTGNPPPPVAGSAPIPPEQDAGQIVEQRLHHLLSLTERFVTHHEPMGMWTPQASVLRGATTTDILVDLPGVSNDQLKITVENDLIMISGRRDIVLNEQRLEMSDVVAMGRFARTFRLAMPIAPQQVVARLAAGVLTIRINTEERAAGSQAPSKS